MTEWRPVLGFEGLYEVSDDGQVVRIATHGKNPKPIRRLVQSHKKPNGYYAIDIQKDGQRHRDYLHRVIWQAFKGPIPSGLEINHKDGNRDRNRLENFELVTRSGNMLHCFEELSPSLNRVRGTEHHKAKLTPDDVLTIVKLSHSKSWSELATMFGVSKNAIRLILIGKNWKHVTGIKPD
jgi:hypothetical protein